MRNTNVSDKNVFSKKVGKIHWQDKKKIKKALEMRA